MNTLIERWNSSTPPFFKKLGFYAKVTAIITGALATGITTVMSAGIAIPILIPAILGGIAAMSTSVAATAGLASDDKNVIDKQYKNTDTINNK